MRISSRFSAVFGLLGLLAIGSARAQDTGVAPAKAARMGYARVGIGVNVAGPLLDLPGRARATQPWTGLHYRTNWNEFGYLAGRFKANGEAGDSAEIGVQAYGGANFPIGAWGVGKRDGTKGMLLIPSLAVGGGAHRMGATTSGFLYLAPTLSLQLPFVLIDLRARASYAPKSLQSGVDRNYSGFTVQPQICLQFDGLWDVFDPKVSYEGHASGSVTSTSRTLVSSGPQYDTYRETTTSSPYDYDMYVVGGPDFLAIAPRATMGIVTAGAGRTWLGGLGVSGRASAFAYDAFVEGGQLGVNGGWSRTPTTAEPAPRKGGEPSSGTPFGGHRPMGRVVVRGGIDLLFLLQSLFTHSDGGGNGATKYVRFTGGWGPGLAVLPGAYTFLDPAQAEVLDGRFAAPAGSPGGNPAGNSTIQNEFSDPRQGRGGYCNQWYMQLEVGVLSVTGEYNRYRNNPMANSAAVTLSYLYPYSLLKKANRDRRGSGAYQAD